MNHVNILEIKKLIGLHPTEYEHPFDRKALDALEGTPGVEILQRKIIKLFYERFARLQYTGSYLQVTENNFPSLYKTYVEVCDTLFYPNKPELYISWDYSINAMAVGTEQPIIVLHSGCIDLLDEDELRFIIGHEIGHCKSKHALYQSMVRIFPHISDALGTATLGIGKIATAGLIGALCHWSRMSEYTSDRAGLLSCQNIDVATRALLKMAGLPIKYFDQNVIKSFEEQAEKFKSFDYSNINKVSKFLLSFDMSHPWTVLRAAQLNDWVTSGGFREVLAKQRLVTFEGFCMECGEVIQMTDVHCGRCGSKTSPWRID